MITAESLEQANSKLATVPIKGKDYVQVTERIKAFRAICPNGRIETKIISLENGVVTMMSEIHDEDGKLIATGFAQEKEANGYINKTSFIENCETSAVGRALGFAGIGIDASMASAEEVANAIINQAGNNKGDAPQKESPAAKIAKLKMELKRTGVTITSLLATYQIKADADSDEKNLAKLSDAQYQDALARFAKTASKA